MFSVLYTICFELTQIQTTQKSGNHCSKGARDRVARLRYGFSSKQKQKICSVRKVTAFISLPVDPSPVLPVQDTAFLNTPDSPSPLDPFDDPDEDDEDWNYHDTQEDATFVQSPQENSSNNFPQQEKRRTAGIRSCPGTPDTHQSESNLFCQYRERKGSLGSMCRSTLPTIGSVPRLDLR